MSLIFDYDTGNNNNDNNINKDDDNNNTNWVSNLRKEQSNSFMLITKRKSDVHVSMSKTRINFIFPLPLAEAFGYPKSRFSKLC